jgi:hypothetical protein
MRWAFLLLGLLIASPAFAANGEGKTTMGFTCAPWDGAAFNLEVKFADELLSATFWGRGYDALTRGERSVALDNMGGGNGDGTGTFYFCNTDHTNCKPIDGVYVKFDNIEFKRGGAADGQIMGYDDKPVPFKGIISSDQARCG